MKKKDIFCRDRKGNAFRPETEDRLKNSPTFDPLLSLNWPGSREFETIH